jgi:hypothetical protein
MRIYRLLFVCALTTLQLASGCVTTTPPPKRQVPKPEAPILSWYIGDCSGSLQGGGCIYEIPSGWALLTSKKRAASDQTGQSALHRQLLVQRAETTQGEWHFLMGDNPSFFSECGTSCPVERVSFWDTLTYLNLRSEDEGLTPCYLLQDCYGSMGQGCAEGEPWCEARHGCKNVHFHGTECDGYRLPTPEEWDWMVMSLAQDKSAPWCADVSDGSPRAQRRGLRGSTVLDALAGNVWEWVWDEPQTPEGPESSHRGSSFLTSAERCYAESESHSSPEFRSYFVGLRPVRTLRLGPHLRRPEQPEPLESDPSMMMSSKQP